MNYLLIIITLISLIIAFISIFTKVKNNNDIENERNKLLENINQLSEQEKEATNRIKELKDTASSLYESQKQVAETAYQNFCESLENEYQEKTKEHNILIENLKTQYDSMQSQFIIQTEKVKNELEILKSTRAALIEANIREKEIKENKDFYSLPISEEDREDIDKLNKIKKNLNKPRVLSMLIWQTYYQKLLKTKTAEIIGTSVKTGIYKITNIETNECYIGQAVDIAKRWSEHAKCGLGIDTPANNKLYQAMQEYGLYNFSWEMLEECPKELLNSKESYYIELYQSKDLGYNSSKGITTK